MLATVFTKATRDRWLGVAIGAGLLALWMLMAMAVYRDIDLSLYTNLPEAIRGVMGIPDGADVATLAYSVLFGFAGSLTLAGLAVSMGTGSIAGEERNGTLGLLLGNPKSRTYVLVSKAASMVLLTVLGSLVVWGAGLATPAILSVDIGNSHVGAFALHMMVNALFYGFLAMAVGAWTGNASLSSGISAGVMVISYFAVGLLPLVQGLEDLVKVFPWYYFDGSQPLVNGVSWGHMAVLVGGIVFFAAAALVGVNRRDLRNNVSRVTVLDRLRANPTTQKIVERLAGSARVSRISIKTASDHQGLLIIVAYVMFLVMGLLLGPMYNAIDDVLADFSASMPDNLLAMFGGGDISTPEGWYQIETFSLMVPIAIIVVTVVIGARAVAGEEARRTMDLLLANPVSRAKIVLEKAAAMIVHAAVVGFATFAGVALGSVISGLGMDTGNIAAASLLGTLLGLVFGALSLVLSAATGRVRLAVYATIGVALTFYLVNSLLQLSERLAGWAKWSPNYYYLTSDPLVNGMHWGHAAVLAALVAGLILLAIPLFQRRDVRG